MAILLEWLIYAAFLSFGGWILVKTTLAFINEKLEKRAKQKANKIGSTL